MCFRWTPASVLAAGIVAGVFISARVTPARGGGSQPDRAARMRQHYGQALAVHAAVIRGDLPGIVEPAQWLAANAGLTPPPAGSERHIDAIRAAARRVADAKDILAAATATSAMLSSCGDCHRAASVMPSAGLPAAPEVGGAVGHMLRHQRAAEQMLQGLVVPSNALWREGAKAFVEAPLHPRELPVSTPDRRQMIDTEERLHRTASQAVEVTDPMLRASLYAEILSACADCHRRHPTIWGPKLR